MFQPNATTLFRADKKHRFRYALPAEVLLFGYLLVMALAGGLIRGSLYDTLLLHGSNAPWLMAVGVVAIAGLAIALLELRLGARWDNEVLRATAFARMWMNTFAILVWIYMVYLLAVLRDPFGAVPLALVGVLFGGFHAWSALRCKRLYCILSPHFHTSELERRLEAERLTVH